MCNITFSTNGTTSHSEPTGWHHIQNRRDDITFSTDGTCWLLHYQDTLLPFKSIRGSSETRLWTGSLNSVPSVPCGAEKHFFSFFFFSPSSSFSTYYSYTYNGHEKVCGIHCALCIFKKEFHSQKQGDNKTTVFRDVTVFQFHRQVLLFLKTCCLHLKSRSSSKHKQLIKKWFFSDLTCTCVYSMSQHLLWSVHVTCSLRPPNFCCRSRHQTVTNFYKPYLASRWKPRGDERSMSDPWVSATKDLNSSYDAR